MELGGADCEVQKQELECMYDNVDDCGEQDTSTAEQAGPDEVIELGGAVGTAVSSMLMALLVGCHFM